MCAYCVTVPVQMKRCNCDRSSHIYSVPFIRPLTHSLVHSFMLCQKQQPHFSVIYAKYFICSLARAIILNWKRTGIKSSRNSNSRGSTKCWAFVPIIYARNDKVKHTSTHLRSVPEKKKDSQSANVELVLVIMQKEWNGIALSLSLSPSLFSSFVPEAEKTFYFPSGVHRPEISRFFITCL